VFNSSTRVTTITSRVNGILNFQTMLKFQNFAIESFKKTLEKETLDTLIKCELHFMEWIHDSICVLESNSNKEIQWKSDKEIALAHKELDVVEVWDVMGSAVGEMPAKRSRTSSVEHMTTTAPETKRCGTSNKEEQRTTFEQDGRRLKTALSKGITASSASSIDSRNDVRKLDARSITENVTKNRLDNHGVKDQSLSLQKDRKENMFAGHGAEKSGQVETEDVHVKEESFGLNDVVKNVEVIDGKKNEESSGLKEVVENVEVTDDKKTKTRSDRMLLL
jgi:hypothetical protein